MPVPVPCEPALEVLRVAAPPMAPVVLLDVDGVVVSGLTPVESVVATPPPMVKAPAVPPDSPLPVELPVVVVVPVL
ncbi:MAG: hypothetical protein ACLPGW_01945 [Roseiarcus sp.]